MSFLLADYGFQTTALDLSKDVLDYAQQRAVLKKGSLRFVQGNLFEISNIFRNEHFDTVFSQGVMEHFSDEEIVRILAEQKKVATKVIFSVPNNRRRFRPAKLYGDERLLTNSKWKTLAGQAGFRSVKIIGGDVTRFSYFLPRVFFEKRLGFWRKYVSAQSILMCS
jgi:2-polyprenyl-3-methyl-5-hydroxy-6-metoxy-1,4-benzoquinol methylase